MLSEIIISCFSVFSYPANGGGFGCGPTPNTCDRAPRNLGGVAYNNGFQMATGMVLRLGTW